MLGEGFGPFNIDHSGGPETLVIKQRHVQYLDPQFPPVLGLLLSDKERPG